MTVKTMTGVSTDTADVIAIGMVVVTILTLIAALKRVKWLMQPLRKVPQSLRSLGLQQTGNRA
jgi:hypothetical protein